MGIHYCDFLWGFLMGKSYGEIPIRKPHNNYWNGLGWAGLGWAGLGWAGLGWAGLGRAGPGRAGPGRAGPG
jgi:hypothetical protein